LTYLHALLLTEVVEAPIYATLLTFLFNVGLTRTLACSVMVNFISHPLFVFVLAPEAARLTSPVTGVVIGELLVWALESALIWRWLKRGLPTITAISLLANSASFLAGLLIL
jgi:hypothetical protein